MIRLVRDIELDINNADKDSADIKRREKERAIKLDKELDKELESRYKLYIKQRRLEEVVAILVFSLVSAAMLGVITWLS